jgi:hypothetical protein
MLSVVSVSFNTHIAYCYSIHDDNGNGTTHVRLARQQGQRLYWQVRCLVAGISLGNEPHVAYFRHCVPSCRGVR